MRLRIEVDQDLKDLFAEDFKEGERAVTRTMRGVATDLKTKWRAQVRSAGLGNKLGNTIRGDSYPKGTDSIGAAALVWTRAPKLIGVFEKGATIRSRDGFWLAIPTKTAGRGRYGRKITPDEWEQRSGRRLVFIYRRGRTALLVDQGLSRYRSRSDNPSFTENRSRRTPNRKSVVIFTLVPQVSLRKRLDLIAEAERVGGSIPARIVANWR